MKRIILLAFLISSQLFFAQCPTVTCPSVLTLTNCTLGQTILATSNYSANITSRWIGPGGLNIASTGTDSSLVNINNVGTYTVEFKDNFSSCVVYDTVQVISGLLNKPIFSLSLKSNTICTNSNMTINFMNAAPYYNGGGAVSYTLLPPSSSTTLPSGALSFLSSYTISACGQYVAIVKEMVNSCLSTFSFVISCSSFSAIPINITGNTTVCLGSSVSFSANGSNQVWSSGITTATMNTIPMTNTTYVVYGNDVNGCPSSGSVSVITNTTCTDVWPGDANSDGIVNNIDVFEIGLAFSSTGASRSPGGNAYTSQFANNWSGTVSTGKNKCHADCNGDGLVNNADTLAIHNNYNLVHSFKNEELTVVDPDFRLVSFPNVVNEGMWNKVDIVLGDSMNFINHVYGIAFDLNYDQSFIETDSVYINYSASFLNAFNQNVDFRKAVFVNGKIYAASVRTDGLDISGEGKIAEFWFKLKSGIPFNSTFNVSLSQSSKINKSGVNVNLTCGSAALQVVSNLVGIQENDLLNKIYFFPNPASQGITLQSTTTSFVKYSLCDVLGREILKGDFVNSKTVDVSSLAKGTYVIRFETEGQLIYKKLVIE